MEVFSEPLDEVALRLLMRFDQGLMSDERRGLSWLMGLSLVHVPVRYGT